MSTPVRSEQHQSGGKKMVGRIFIAGTAGLVIASAANAQGERYRAAYQVGQQVMFSISGSAGDFHPCVVTENRPGAVMRVRCQAFRHWSAGNYIVYGPEYIRPAGPTGAAPAPSRTTTPAARPAPIPARNGGGGGLKIGEYACYGSGGRIMIGLGFKVLPGGRYTDLEGRNPGSYVVSGGTVRFQGGHLGGQTGRELNNGRFRIGAQASCEPF